MKAWAKAQELFGPKTVTLCHIPGGDPQSATTITVDASAVAAHIAHGDHLGPCGGGEERPKRVAGSILAR